MKTIRMLLGAVILIAAGMLLLKSSGTAIDPGRSALPGASTKDESVSGEAKSGPERMREFLTQLYGRDPDLISDAERASWLAQVEAMPKERGAGLAGGTAWQSIGPNTLNAGGGVNWTGRVRDIEAPAHQPLRVAAATGGLWEWRVIGIIPVVVPLTETLDTQVISTFATHPTNPDHIVVGTGEYSTGWFGTGFRYTTNRGVTWLNGSITNTTPPWGVYRVRFSSDGTTVHAATPLGYYRSDDMGATWTRRFAMSMTDIALHPTNSNFLYGVVPGVGQGVYRSGDKGTTWTKIFGVPATDTVGHGSITTTRANVQRLYVSLSNQDQNTLGIWRSSNGGTTWTPLSPGTVMAGMGNYCNAITASPVDANVVLVGAVTLHQSKDGGATWTDVSYAPHVHVDHHAFAWDTTGVRTLYVGNDGGVAVSTNDGATWSTTTNVYPITQFYSIDAGRNDEGIADGGTGVFAGANQDNGYAITTNGGDTWQSPACCDGGFVTIDPADPDIMLGSRGISTAPLTFPRERSLDRGATWSGINTGIAGANTSTPRVRHDLVPPVWYYTHEGGTVYYSNSQGSSWIKLNTAPFSPNVFALSASRYSAPRATVYASLLSNATGNRLWVWDGPAGAWFERSTGLPSGIVRLVATSLTEPARGYAIMNGTGGPGQKIYKTTNRGSAWTNITGNLPDIPYTDLVESPSNANILVLSSLFGCFRTTDAGASWHVWDDGMPRNVLVVSLAIIDQRVSELGLLSILAGTHGRSAWKRVIHGIDVVSVSTGQQAEDRVQLSPNPLRRTGEVRFTMPAAGNAQVRVFDAAGRLVETLANGHLGAGVHRYPLSADRLSPGIYFLRHESARRTSTAKFTVVR